MKKIFKFVILPAFLNLVIIFSAFGKIIPQTNADIGNLDSESWWLNYAVRQADKITDSNCKDDIYGYLGRAQALAGDVNGANSSASRILNSQNRIYIHIFAAETFYKQGNQAGYKKSIQPAMSVALAEKNVASQIFINGAMIRAYLDCNDVNEAKSYAESIKDRRQAQQAYQTIAAYLAQNGDIKSADVILNNNIQLSGKEGAVVEIAETCIRKGNLSDAEQMAQRLNRPEFKDRVYDKLGVAFAEKGSIEKARAAAQMISDPMHKSSVITAIAKYQINRGDIDAGKNTAQEVSSRDHKIAIYTLITEKLADEGKIDSAVAAIEMMTKMIDDTPLAADESKFGSFDDSFKQGMTQMVYLRVAKTLAKKGDLEGYNKYITKAIDGVRKINAAPLWLTFALFVHDYAAVATASMKNSIIRAGTV